MSKYILGLILNVLLSWVVYSVLINIEDPKEALAWIGAVLVYLLRTIEDRL